MMKRKVGTLSSALGLIFLGVLIIIVRINPQLGYNISAFWPTIIILLGVEVLYLSLTKKEGELIGFNPLIILVLILFLITNVYVSMKYHFSNGNGFVSNITNFIDDAIAHQDKFDKNFNFNFKKYNVKVNEEFNNVPKKIEINSNNGSVELIPSGNKNMRIDGTVSLEEDIKDYKIKTINDNDKLTLNFTDNMERDIKLKIYIPDDGELSINGDNFRIIGEDKFKKLNYKVNVDNLNLNLKSGNSLNVDSDNAHVSISDIANVEYYADNATITANGDIESFKCELDNGTVSLENKKCSNVDVKIGIGTITVRTNEKNVSVSTRCDLGTINFNGEKKVNGNVSKNFGNEQGKVNLEVDTGKVNFFN